MTSSRRGKAGQGCTRVNLLPRIPSVAQPAPSLPERNIVDDEPPLDPDAVSRSYRHHRARREARAKRHRAKRWASVRFWLVLVLVLVVTAVIAARTLGEIERVFGI